MNLLYKMFGKLATQEIMRRDFRRNAKGVARALGIASNIKGMPSGIASRMNQVKTPFRAIAKKPIKNIAKRFKTKFKRKRRGRINRYKKRVNKSKSKRLRARKLERLRTRNIRGRFG